MKPLLHLFLALTLLLQGAMAAAMTPPPAPAPMEMGEMAMPCHDMAKTQSSMPCCERANATCHAMCAAATLPADFHLPPVAPAGIESAAPVRAGILLAHRATPLRPPILHSA